MSGQIISGDRDQSGRLAEHPVDVNQLDEAQDKGTEVVDASNREQRQAESAAKELDVPAGPICLVTFQDPSAP